MRQLDPQVRALIEAAAQTASPPRASLSPDEARALYRKSRAPLRPPAPEVAAVREWAVPGPGGTLTLRMVRGTGIADDQTPPVLVYFHGGGWVLGDLETHDVICRQLANAARCAVIAVDYRLAPEHKFPAAFEDGVAAVRWVAAHAAELGVDAAHIGIAGDSAGANIAAAAAIALRDTGGPALVMQLLVYPVTDLEMETASYRADTSRYMLTRDDMLWFRDQYLRGEADIADWRASPLRAADLSGLPPTYVVTAGFDPLLDEGRAYADRLRAAGVDVTYECFEGMVHGFLTMGAALAASHHAIYRLAQCFTRELARLREGVRPPRP